MELKRLDRLSSLKEGIVTYPEPSKDKSRIFITGFINRLLENGAIDEACATEWKENLEKDLMQSCT